MIRCVRYMEVAFRFAQTVAAHIATHTTSVISVALHGDAISNRAAITAKLTRSVAGVREVHSVGRFALAPLVPPAQRLIHAQCVKSASHEGRLFGNFNICS